MFNNEQKGDGEEVLIVDKPVESEDVSLIQDELDDALIEKLEQPTDRMPGISDDGGQPRSADFGTSPGSQMASSEGDALNFTDGDLSDEG